MDIIQRAQQKREWHLSEAARLEAFLATAFDLEEELKAAPPAPSPLSNATKADLPKKAATRPLAGIGADTINAAEAIIREHGPMSTRDMLPLVRAKGIDVGGKDPVATLSARISGRGDLETIRGKWHFRGSSELNGSGEKEAADHPAKDQSTASSVHSNQGGTDGTALI